MLTGLSRTIGRKKNLNRKKGKKEKKVRNNNSFNNYLENIDFAKVAVKNKCKAYMKKQKLKEIDDFLKSK